MKNIWGIGAMGLLVSTTLLAAVDASSLKTPEDKISYIIGTDVGKNFTRQNIKVNPAIFEKGLEDGLSGAKLLLSDQEMKDELAKFQKTMMEKRAAEMNQKSSENKTKGEAFLAANKAKAGVVALPSGLQYKVVTMGTGVKPGKEDMVTVEYTGRLINGEVFDSTEKAGKPATFKLSQVIPGWTEALQLMPAGSTWEVYIPSNLAYGERSAGAAIGPNETLVFNVHLIDVKKEDKKS
ncbi:MAG: FKBP-type peptidyl-prolyl cis-trans isomerase [Legionellaceae bacterium]